MLRAYLTTVVIMLGVVLCTPLSSSAQAFKDPNYPNDRKFINSSKVFTDPEADDLLLRIKKSVRKERWDDAMRMFVDLSTNYRNRVVKTEEGRYRGIRDLVIDRFTNLPTAATLAFRNVFDATLKQELKKAIQDRDSLSLNRIGFDMFMSSYSDTALFTLLELEFERGRFKQALLAGNELLSRQHAAAKYNPTVLARLGQLYKVTQNTAQLNALKIMVDQMDLVLVKDKQTLKQFFSTLTASATVTITGTVVVKADSSWRQFGGNNSNTKISSSSIHPMDYKWKTPFSDRRKAGNPIRTFHIEDFGVDADYNIQRQETKLYAPTQAVMSGNFVFVHTNDSVFCFNVYTGYKQWGWESPVVSKYYYEDTNTIHGSLLYDNMLIVPIEKPFRGKMDMYANHYPVKPYIPDRALMAFDVLTGEILWEQGENDLHPDISYCSYPIAPIAYEGKLYAVSTVEIGETVTQSLVCLDPTDGKVLWQLSLCHGIAESNMFGRVLRESAPTAPVIVDDLFIYGSNLGSIIAVDLSTKDVEWISYYEALAIPRAQGLEIKWRPQRWGANPLMYQDGMVYLAAVDSPSLLAFDVQVGALVWEYPRQGGDKYTLGIVDNKIIVSGKRLTAVDTQTGARLWSMIPRDVWDLAGRGMLTADTIYVPDKNGLGKVNFAGNLTSSLLPWRNKNEAGNLVASNKVTVSAGAQSSQQLFIAAYYNFDQIADKLLTDLRNQPDNPVAHYELGSIYQYAGKTDQAMRYLKSSYVLASANPELYSELQLQLRQALYMTYRQLGDDIWQKTTQAAAKVQYQKALEYANSKEDTIQVLLRLDVIYQAVNNLPQRLVLYEDMLARFPNVDYAFDDEPVKVGLYALLRLLDLSKRGPEPAKQQLVYLQKLISDYRHSVWHGVVIGQFAYAKISTLIQTQGRVLYSVQDKQAQALLQDATMLSLQKVLTDYPNASNLNEALKILTGRLLADKKTVKLRRILRDFSSAFPAHVVNADVLMFMAMAFEEDSFYDNAYGILLKLNKEFPQQMLNTQAGPVQCKVYVDKLLTTRKQYQRLLRPDEVVELQLPLLETATKKETEQGALVLQLQGVSGLFKDLVFVAERGKLTIYDGRGETVIAILILSDRDQAKAIFLSGTHLIVECHRMINIFDMSAFTLKSSKATLLWDLVLDEDIIDLRVNYGFIIAAVRSSASRFQSLLSCYDVTNGDLLWGPLVTSRSIRNLLVSSASVIYSDGTDVHFIDIFSGLENLVVSDVNYQVPVLVNSTTVAVPYLVNRQQNVIAIVDTMKAVRVREINVGIRRGVFFLTANAQILVVSNNNVLTAYSVQNAKVLWKHTNPTKIRKMWIAGDQLFYLTRQQQRKDKKYLENLSVASRKLDDGSELWVCELNAETQYRMTPAFSLSSGNTLIIKYSYYMSQLRRSENHLVFVDAKEGKLIQRLKVFPGLRDGMFIVTERGIAMSNSEQAVLFYASEQQQVDGK